MGDSPHDLSGRPSNDDGVLLRQFHGQTSAIIDASPTKVFAAITQVDRVSQWNKRIASVVRAPGTPLGEGAEWTVQMWVPPAKWKSRSHVVEYDPDRLVFEHTSQSDDGNPSYLAWRWTVAPDSGGSKVTVEWTGYPRTFWRQLIFARYRSKQLRSEVPASLDALAYHLAPEERADRR
jgi:uncharacterized protein YndB with AHSA1/START domain